MAQNTITTKGVLIINGKQVENTFKDLQTTTRKLEAELRKLKPGTQEFIEKAQQVKLARQAFENVRNEIKATTTEIVNSGGIVDRFITKMGGLGNTLTFIGSIWSGWRGIGAVTDNLLKISDAITDVQKTSGLAQKEVEALWKEFSNFDTRTSKLELMNIAQIGGRLGITDKEQLQEFTREIDKIYVALGDSFQGGLEEVTTKVGKLKNLFDQTKDSDYPTALNEIGSALNELGANGTASESNITEFATRIGQLPSALKPAIDRTLGLGAAFEESGIDAQIAASGYSRFMSVAGNNLEAFAQQMKITKDEAQALFRTKPEEFFIRFGESMKGIPADQTAKILKNLDLNTLEIKKSLGAAGDNAGRFREMMELSSKSMIEATSIQEEFNKKNNNAAAVWEKIGRALKDFVTDGAVPDFFNWITGIVGKITGVYNEAGNGMKVFRERLSFLVKILTVVTTSVLSYRAAMWLATTTTKGAWQQTILFNAVQKASNAIFVANRTMLLIINVLFRTFTFNLAGAKKAMDAFNLSTKMNPWGAMLAVVTAAIGAWVAFKDRTDKAVRGISEYQEAVAQSKAETSAHTGKVQSLMKTLNDSTISIETKKEALAELKRITGGYLDTLTLENIQTSQSIGLVNAYVLAMERLAEAKASNALKEKKYNEKAETEARLAGLKKEKEATSDSGSLWGSDGKLFGFEVSRNKNSIQEDINEAEKKLKEINEDIEYSKNKNNEIVKQAQDNIKALELSLKEAEKQGNKIAISILQNEINQNKKILNQALGITEPIATTNNLPTDASVPSKSSGNPKKDHSSEYQNAKKARLQAEQELQKEITQGTLQFRTRTRNSDPVRQ